MLSAFLLWSFLLLSATKTLGVVLRSQPDLDTQAHDEEDHIPTLRLRDVTESETTAFRHLRYSREDPPAAKRRRTE